MAPLSQVLHAAAGAGIGGGAAILLLALKPSLAGAGPGLRSSKPRRPATAARTVSTSRGNLLVALAVGLLAAALTRWPMAFALAGLATLAARGLGGRARAAPVAKLEAVAVWTEMLRDTLAGASGLTQAIVATADPAPPELREEVRALAEKLQLGVPLEAGLRELGDAVADPALDLLVASLVMATRERAQRLGDLLGALSTSMREEVAMRLGVDAARASSRAAVRTVTGFSLALFAAMALFAHSYLAPYSSAAGQLMLTLVGLLFGTGLWMMAVMVRPKLLPRLQLAPAGPQPGEAGRQ